MRGRDLGVEQREGGGGVKEGRDASIFRTVKQHPLPQLFLPTSLPAHTHHPHNGMYAISRLQTKLSSIGSQARV